MANEDWYRNAKAQLLPLKKYKRRGVVSTEQKLGLCWKSLLHLVPPFPSLSPPLLHLFLWEILPSHTVGPRAESFSPVLLFVTLWTIAHQAPLSMGFSRQGYGSGLHALLWRIFLTQRLNPSPASPALRVNSVPLCHQGGPFHILIACKSSTQGLLPKSHSYLIGSSSAPVHSVHRWLTPSISPQIFVEGPPRAGPMVGMEKGPSG